MASLDSGYFAVELFCGTGNLTLAMKHFLSDSFGVDHAVKQQKVKVIPLDLSTSSSQKLVVEWCKSPQCLWVHFGVPCGTASKARLRKLSRKHHGPPKLRSQKWPDGLPWLRGVLKLKVQKANVLYTFMVNLILQLDTDKICWTVENPWTSFLWETSIWHRLRQLCPHYVEVHNCMYGGTRLKRTCLASNNPAVLQMQRLCDGQHEHQAWSVHNGKFDTSLEAEYTPEFARALATTIFGSLVSTSGLLQFSSHCKKLKLSHFASVATHKQPKVLPPVVPEFAYFVVLYNLSPSLLQVNVKSELVHCVDIHFASRVVSLPCGSKQARLTIHKGGKGRQPSFEMVNLRSLQMLGDLDAADANSLASLAAEKSDQVSKTTTPKSCSCGSLQCDATAMPAEGQDTCDRVFGVRWTDEQFLLQARHNGHPFDAFSGIDSEVKQACEFLAASSDSQVIDFRARALQRWIAKAKELHYEELHLKSTLVPEVRRILASKRLELMRWIIRDTGYYDVNLAEDVIAGFSLVGDVPKSHLLPSKFVPAQLAVEDLHAQSKRSNIAIRQMTRPSGSLETDAQLWDKTPSEADAGWLTGPHSWQSLDADAAVSRRFPLVQSSKLRPIDDYSQSQVNSTVTLHEKPTVDNADVVAAIFIYFMQALFSNGRCTRLVSRSLDLASAYRQLAIEPASFKYAYISVYDPTSCSAALFQQVALPFGSRTAVNAFIRCARFLQWVAARCLAIPMSCYFDDFVISSTPSLASNAQQSASLMFDLLGWAYDRSGNKADVFSDVVSALGVMFDLSASVTGTVRVSNTPKRVGEGGR